MTAWELREAARGVGQRLEEDYRTALNVAWHGAAFDRSKRLPDLNKLLQRSEKSAPEQGVDEGALIIVMQQYNERLRERNGEAR